MGAVLLKATEISEDIFLLSEDIFLLLVKEKKILDQVHKFPHVGRFMHLIQKVAILHSQCTLPRTFTYQACPFSVHCLSFNALPAEIRTRNHGISTVLMFLRINLITNWGKFCTCCCLGENFALVSKFLSDHHQNPNHVAVEYIFSDSIFI